MTRRTTLEVYFNDTKAGTLTELSPGKGYVFRYDGDYLASDLPAIAIGMPKRAAEYTSDLLFPFFANMLPEGENRKAICLLWKIDEHDLYGLLCAMAGADFIGAVHVV